MIRRPLCVSRCLCTWTVTFYCLLLRRYLPHPPDIRRPFRVSRCLCTRIFHRTLDLRMGWCFLLTLRPFRPHLQEIRRPMCVSRCLCTRMGSFRSLTTTCDSSANVCAPLSWNGCAIRGKFWLRLVWDTFCSIKILPIGCRMVLVVQHNDHGQHEAEVLIIIAG